MIYRIFKENEEKTQEYEFLIIISLITIKWLKNYYYYYYYYYYYC